MMSRFASFICVCRCYIPSAMDCHDGACHADSGAMSRLFALTIFCGSFLLFLVQPIIAKELLPRFGGSASVWVTCLVFFQSALLLGYAGADRFVTLVPARLRILLVVVVVLAAAAVLPIVPPAPGGRGFTNPALS